MTFVEVMVSAVILSVGLVGVYRALFTGVDYLQYLATRLRAVALVDSRLGALEKALRSGQKPDIGPLRETLTLQGRPLDVAWDFTVLPVDGLVSVFQLDMALSWKERGRTVTVRRGAYLSAVPVAGGGG